jgi:lipoate-protein ligase B
MSVALLDLGRRPYSEVWELQKRLVSERSAGSIGDTVILVEHDHVITLGRKTSPENFRPQNISVVQVERGGDATYHGPGQLVGYPILKLESPDVHAYLRRLEEVIILASKEFSIDAGRKEKHTGVWVGDRKLASIGVAVSNWVTYHGFALNVNTDLTYFGLIKPCGLDPNTMTSMEKLLGGKVEMDAVKRAVMARFSEVFACEVIPGRPGLQNAPIRAA